MKDRNDKHKFKESKIGKIIYGFLLFMPLFAIGVTCLTTLWNKTIEMPSQEVIQESVYETNDVNSVNDLIQGNIYNFTITSNYVDTSISYFSAYKIYNLDNDTKKISIDAEELGNTYFFFIETAQYWQIKSSNNMTFNLVDYANKSQLVDKTFQFVYHGNFNEQFISNVAKATWIPQSSYEIIEHESTDLNVFYYAVDKVTQSNLFNWVTTSNIYTGMHNFTTAMSVTNTFIPMLLTYWLIISVIYFLYDMVLILLTVLHRKIHNLQDSI